MGSLIIDSLYGSNLLKYQLDSNDLIDDAAVKKINFSRSGSLIPVTVNRSSDSTSLECNAIGLEPLISEGPIIPRKYLRILALQILKIIHECEAGDIDPSYLFFDKNGVYLVKNTSGLGSVNMVCWPVISKQKNWDKPEEFLAKLPEMLVPDKGESQRFVNDYISFFKGSNALSLSSLEYFLENCAEDNDRLAGENVRRPRGFTVPKVKPVYHNSEGSIEYDPFAPEIPVEKKTNISHEIQNTDFHANHVFVNNHQTVPTGEKPPEKVLSERPRVLSLVPAETDNTDSGSALFCSYCGEKVSVPGSSFCSKCGNRLESGNCKIQNAGNVHQPAEVPVTHPHPEQHPKNDIIIEEDRHTVLVGTGANSDEEEIDSQNYEPEAELEIRATLYMFRKGETYCIDVPVFRIGSKMSQCELWISDNRYISRLHAAINKKSNNYFITDMNSTNKTYLNEMLLEPEKPYILHSGDLIRLANEEFVFTIDQI